MRVTIAPTKKIGGLTWDDREMLDTIYTLYTRYNRALFVPLVNICRELVGMSKGQPTPKQFEAVKEQILRLTETRMTLECGGWTDRRTGEYIQNVIEGHMMDAVIIDQTINNQPNVPTLCLKGTPLVFYHAEMLNHVITYPSALKQVAGLNMTKALRRVETYLLWRIGIARNELGQRVQRAANSKGEMVRKSNVIILDIGTICTQANLIDPTTTERARNRKMKEMDPKIKTILEWWVQCQWIRGVKVDPEHKDRLKVKIGMEAEPQDIV